MFYSSILKVVLPKVLVYIYNGKIKNISIDKLLVGLLNSNSKRYYLGTGGKHGCTEEKHHTAKACTRCGS